MTSTRIGPVLCVLALATQPAVSHAGLVNGIRKTIAACGRRLQPASSSNLYAAQTLRNGERVDARVWLEAVPIHLAILLRDSPGFVDDVVALAEDRVKTVPPAVKDDLIRRGLMRTDGFLEPDVAKVLRASVKHGAGGQTYFVSPSRPALLSDSKLRKYLKRVDRRVVAGIIRIARANGLAINASRSAPEIDGPRVPADGSLLVDLGGANEAVTLITPFGRLAVTTNSGLGSPREWDQVKELIKKGLALVPAAVGTDLDESRVFAATRDFNRGIFQFPDDPPTLSTAPPKNWKAKWNALRPGARGEFADAD